MSLIGLVVMCGIVINDSILKVDTINQIRKSGRSVMYAVMDAGKRRLNPILMTSLTTILGVAPFLVRGDMGSDLQYPLSIALIGGMVIGTLVSIFFIPIAYYVIYRKRT
jgi:multidrug efflux pump subunit AcrB